MANKVGVLIKEARTKAGFTQEGLAKLIDGVSASDISKAERGEKELSQTALKQIAKATGVTQKSLLEASKAEGSKPAASSSAKKSSDDTFKLTAAEKTLVELYRKADAETKKSAVSILKGEKPDVGEMLSGILGSTVLNGKKTDSGDMLSDIIGGLLGKK